VKNKGNKRARQGWLVGKSDCDEAEWLLTAVPEEERVACFCYELARESKAARRAVTRYRTDFAEAERRAWAEAQSEAFRDGIPPEDIDTLVDAKLAKRIDVKERERVERQAKGARAYFNVLEFPDTPWRLLHSTVRSRLVKSNAGFESRTLELVCELDSGNPVPLPAEFWSNSAVFWGMTFKVHRAEDRLLVFHVRLDGDVNDAISTFRRTFAQLRQKHGIPPRPVKRGRKGKGDLPAPLDALRAVGAMRVLAFGLSETEREPLLRKLGFGEHEAGGALESHRNISASARNSAATCLRVFAKLFGDSTGPINSVGDAG
jgi:hypothetical protein